MFGVSLLAFAFLYEDTKYDPVDTGEVPATEIERRVNSISADTLGLLRSILVEFTTQIIHRALILHEQDVHMKGEIKVWRSKADPKVCAPCAA